MSGWLEALDAITQDVSKGLYVLTLLVLLTLLLVVILLVLYVWQKYTALPVGAKFLVGVAVAIVIVIAGLIVGWIAEEAVYAVLEALIRWATHRWRLFDGFTRQHPWVGYLLLGLLVILGWNYVKD